MIKIKNTEKQWLSPKLLSSLSINVTKQWKTRFEKQDFSTKSIYELLSKDLKKKMFSHCILWILMVCYSLLDENTKILKI